MCARQTADKPVASSSLTYSHIEMEMMKDRIAYIRSIAKNAHAE